jgi:hypothetical protein
MQWIKDMPLLESVIDLQGLCLSAIEQANTNSKGKDPATDKSKQRKATSSKKCGCLIGGLAQAAIDDVNEVIDSVSNTAVVLVTD